MRVRVLFDSYDKVMQNPAGGVQSRIRHLSDSLLPFCEVKLFDKWSDKFNDYDILHIFKIGPDRYEIIKAAKQSGLKIVISTVVPVEPFSVRQRLSKNIAKLPLMTGYKYTKMALQNADVLLPQSSAEKEYINRLYGIPKNKMTVVPNGCNYDFSTSEIDQSFVEKYKIEKPYVLCVGRIDHNKNQLNLIKALRNTDIELYLVGGSDFGDVSYFEECKKYATNNIHFCGWIDSKDPLLFSAYQNARVTVLPSYSEIFGNSLMEGACAGNNLASTNKLTTLNDYGIREHVTVFDPSNPHDIHRAICNEYNKVNDQKQGEYFRNIFSWKKIAEKHFEIYKKLCTESNYDDNFC